MEQAVGALRRLKNPIDLQWLFGIRHEWPKLELAESRRTRCFHDLQRLGVDVCSIQEGHLGNIFEHMLLNVLVFLSLFL